jgi:hypothetical protein
VVHEPESESPFDAKPASTGPAIYIPSRTDDLIVTHPKEQAAPAPAKGTDRFDLVCRSLGPFFGQCPNRTPDDAFTTRFAARFNPRLVPKTRDFRLDTSIDKINGVSALYFRTGAHTYTAKHTSVGIKVKKRIRVVNRESGFPKFQPFQPFLVHTHMIDNPLKRALGVLFTDETVRVVVGNKEFQGDLPDLSKFGAFRSYNHSVLGRGFTGNSRSSPIYFNYAEPAGAH